MSDIPSGALDAGRRRKAVSLLSRVILPRPGDPLDVRTLYIEESSTNARRAHAPTRTTLEIGAESEVSFATYFNAFPASYWRRWSMLESVVLRVELTGSARVDVYRSKATGARITVGGTEAVGAEDGDAGRRGVRARPRPVRGRRLDLVRHHHRHQGDRARAPAGTRRSPAPGRADVAIGIPTFNRPADCVDALAALTSDPLVDEVISAVIVSDQGTKQGQGPSRLRRRRRRARRPVADARPAQPRRLRRLQPGHVRGAEEHRLRTDPVHGRRHPARARLDPAGAGVQPVRQDADARRRSDAHPAGALAPARDGRDGRPANFLWTNAVNTEYDHDFAKYSLNARSRSAASCCTAASTSTTTAGGCA